MNITHKWLQTQKLIDARIVYDLRKQSSSQLVVSPAPFVVETCKYLRLPKRDIHRLFNIQWISIHLLLLHTKQNDSMIQWCTIEFDN